MHALLLNLKKGSLVGLVIAGFLVASTGVASANSVTLSQSPGLCGACGPSTYSVSSSFTVTIFANLGPTGGGQEGVNVSLLYDPAFVTAADCAEAPGGQTVGGGTYAPLTPNCGVGSPGLDALAVPGQVVGIEQFFTGTGVQGTSGTLILGTVTFHASAVTPVTNINSALAPFPGGGFLGADFVLRNPGIPLGTVTVTIVPEPTTLVLLGIGVLGLGLSSRRMRRR